MKTRDIRVCIVRVAGTNCDEETKRSLDDQGVEAEINHLNVLVKRQNLLDYDALVFPGGFSHGDYVRAGAIWAKETLAKLGHGLKMFVEEGKPILGICNGFQMLVEGGLLPAFEGVSEIPESALATNVPIGYNCSWVYVKHENSGKCVLTREIPKGKVLRIPVAHGEGRFVFPKVSEKRFLDRLYDNDQLVFRYCNEKGTYADGEYPLNPNGSFHDIAGICNPDGTILGLMPHPERAYYGWQLPDWTLKEKTPTNGDGMLIIKSIVSYLSKKF
jgi:phosphoribosylformylglycinamidine synthase I